MPARISINAETWLVESRTYPGVAKPFSLPEFHALTDEQQALVHSAYFSLLPNRYRAARQGRGGPRVAFRANNPNATRWPSVDHLRGGDHFYDMSVGNEELCRRKKMIRCICKFKFLLVFGCGHQGHLKCQFEECNDCIESIIARCPDTDNPEQVSAFVERKLDSVLARWYDVDHFIQMVKTLGFGAYCADFKKYLKELL